ncbi:MAG: BMP family ABC transporter substrate-binding protein [Firmicutes bacterium]|nr:BMP family ABC transporter substrate-binding protein [Bacillota bacterium]
MKKLLVLLLGLALVFTFAACGGGNEEPAEDTPEEESGEAAETGDFKLGVVLIGDENEGYTWAHMEGIQKACESLGIDHTDSNQVVWKYVVPEDESCYDACIDLVDQGCTLVITNSYGHQSYAQQAAAECPDVTFISMTGDTAAQSGLPNFKNAFNYTYESRYVGGVVAGMKLQELIDEGKVPASAIDADGNYKIGYVGAYPYAEVVSGYTGFYLGVKSIVENVAMEVLYTNSWFDITKEAEAENTLIADGCIITSQHADSTGAPSAAQAALEAGTPVYHVGYNVDMLATAPDAALTSAQNDWSVYYTYAIGAAMKGEEIATDWAEGYDAGAVMISQLGPSCAEGTAEKVAEVEAALAAGELDVFDCANFTVGGETVTSFMAIDVDGDFVGDEGEAIEDGVFKESVLRSAPYFSLRIDGIKELN